MSKISEIYSEKEMNERLRDAIETYAVINGASLLNIAGAIAPSKRAQKVAAARVLSVLEEYLQWHEEVEAAVDTMLNGEQP